MNDHVRVVPPIDLPLDRPCTDCGREPFRGRERHHVGCPQVRDDEQRFLAATGLTPATKITVEDWQRMTEREVMA